MLELGEGSSCIVIGVLLRDEDRVLLDVFPVEAVVVVVV